MAQYTLFNQTVNFSAGSERFYDFNHSASETLKQVCAEFERWYKNSGDILTVINGFENIVGELIVKYVTAPLFSELVDLEIYDISQERYVNECVAIDDSCEALGSIIEKYNEIVSEQEEKVEYRAQRKANRARVVGGGFGINGAVKGMATAGAMNAASGIGHSLLNAIGNAASAMAASSSKRALYNDENTSAILCTGLKRDVLSCIYAHIQLVNSRIRGYYEDVFDVEKAEALLESARRVESKRQELLIDAFKLCPWSKNLLSYIFCCFSTERKRVWDIGKRFHVDLHQTAEILFASVYTDEVKQSEADMNFVMKWIRAQMKELGISGSATLSQMEQDGIRLIFGDYIQADKNQRQEMFASLKSYDATHENKVKMVHELRVWEIAEEYGVVFTEEEVEDILGALYGENAKSNEQEALRAKQNIKTVMEALKVSKSDTFDSLEKDCLKRLCKDYSKADTATCNEMIRKIEAYDAEQRNKDDYLKKLKERKQDIVAQSEDAEFYKRFQATNIKKKQEVAEALQYFAGKESSSQAWKYQRILSRCTRRNIRKARRSRGFLGKFCKYFGYILILLGVLLLFVKVDIATRVVAFAIGGFFEYIFHKWDRTWDDLTYCGKVVHRLLE